MKTFIIAISIVQALVIIVGFLWILRLVYTGFKNKDQSKYKRALITLLLIWTTLLVLQLTEFGILKLL